MTSKRFYSLLVIIAVAGLWYLLRDSQLEAEKKLAAAKEASYQRAELKQAPISTSALASRAPSSEKKEASSLLDMTKTLSQYTKPESRFQDLIGYLDRSGQKPFVVKNENAYTGEMVVVRTKSPLKGTRYFHAQYFTDEANHRFVQHMSFEYKPGPQAMKEAVSAIQEAFPQLPKADTVRAGYARWSLKDQGYIVWVKKMTADDLKDDPFNAYSPNDVGTIRVAIESEVHGEDDVH